MLSERYILLLAMSALSLLALGGACWSSAALYRGLQARSLMLSALLLVNAALAAQVAIVTHHT